jgi:hypothetical protein
MLIALPFSITEKGMATYRQVNGTFYDSRTPDAVVQVLERCRLNGARVRLHYGGSETGRDWLEEWDVAGTIGRSMGPVKVPLLIANCRSTGGPALLDHCLVKITSGRHILYQHPRYHHEPISMRAVADSQHPDLKVTVCVGGQAHARFSTVEKARRWLGRMNLSL